MLLAFAGTTIPKTIFERLPELHFSQTLAGTIISPKTEYGGCVVDYGDIFGGDYYIRKDRLMEEMCLTAKTN